MSASEQNSVAAILGGFVHLVLWITLIISVMILVLFGLGLMASLNGGELKAPLVDALSTDVTPEQFIAALAASFVILPGIIYICVQLRRILRTLAAGDPFVPENAPRLLKIAAAIAIMELARYAVIILLMIFVDFGDGETGPRFSVSFVAWVSAAAMLVFSQVFREGSRLREEEKMTV